MQRSTTLQSWQLKDLRDGDLFAFYIPSHKISEERITAELVRLQRHVTKMKKGFLTTPHTRKGLRWFFYDMQHYVLPKCESLLAELREIVNVHGAANIAFYLNVIRLTEDGKREKAQALGAQPGGEPPLSSPPPSTGGGGPSPFEREAILRDEVLTLSNGKYRDVIHSGNIVYVLQKLRDYFRENFVRGEVQVPDHLREIEEEIRALEDKAARDVPGNEQQAEEEDDVESEYDSSDSAEGGRPGRPPRISDFDQPPATYGDADFSTDTASEVAQNLEYLRIRPEGTQPPPALDEPEDPKVSPPRRGQSSVDPRTQGGYALDDWGSDSTISF